MHVNRLFTKLHMAKSARNKLRDRSGKLSNFEMGLIIAIVAMALFFVVLFVRYYGQQMAHGNDALKENTAKSVAVVNSNNGSGCVVNGCSGGDCVHKFGDSYMGYYDNVGNKILSKPPKEGYNENTQNEIAGTKYIGERNTMVIRVIAHDGDINLSWVKAANYQ